MPDRDTNVQKCNVCVVAYVWNNSSLTMSGTFWVLWYYNEFIIIIIIIEEFLVCLLHNDLSWCLNIHLLKVVWHGSIVVKTLDLRSESKVIHVSSNTVSRDDPGQVVSTYTWHKAVYLILVAVNGQCCATVTERGYSSFKPVSCGWLWYVYMPDSSSFCPSVPKVNGHKMHCSVAGFTHIYCVHMELAMKHLHWLTVDQRITYKLLSTCAPHLHWPGPTVFEILYIYSFCV